MNIALEHKTPWQHLEVGRGERGRLSAQFVELRVWTPDRVGQLEELWLVIRRDPDGRLTPNLLNDLPDTDMDTLVRASCQRYFVKRVIVDGKCESGWDDFLRTQVFGVGAPRGTDGRGVVVCGTGQASSIANVRDSLQAALPLPPLGPPQAAKLLAKHLVNRTRSTSSRLKKQ